MAACTSLDRSGSSL
jgi:hypothetical protein